MHRFLSRGPLSMRLADPNWKVLVAIVLVLMTAFLGALYSFSPRYSLKSTSAWQADALTSWNLTGTDDPSIVGMNWDNKTLALRSRSPVPNGDRFNAKAQPALNVDASTYGFLSFKVATSSQDVAIVATVWTSINTSQNVMLSTFNDEKPHSVIIDLHFQAINKRIVGIALGFQMLADQEICWAQYSDIQLQGIGTVLGQ